MTELPFDVNTPKESIGVVETIIELDSDIHERVAEVNGESACNFCGYDRGFKRRHTEAPGLVVECMACKQTLHRE